MQDLIDKCLQVTRHSYSPYSKFPVGAALLADDGSVFTGQSCLNVSGIYSVTCVNDLRCNSQDATSSLRPTHSPSAPKGRQSWKLCQKVIESSRPWLSRGTYILNYMSTHLWISNHWTYYWFLKFKNPGWFSSTLWFLPTSACRGKKTFVRYTTCTPYVRSWCN